MPEQISKHPDVTLQVLREAGAQCGPNVPKKILTQCPAESFCSFPSGEVCVYGIAQIPQMTQITAKELAQVVCPATPLTGTGPVPDSPGLEIWPLGITFALGLAIGAVARRPRRHG
jgi:hypothetical protein